MRHPALIPLSRDHHHTLRAAHRLSGAAGSAAETRREQAAEFATFFAHEAGTHFRQEEELIFPLLEPGHPLVAEAVAQHARLRALASRLARQEQAGDVDPQLLTQLGSELEAHVRFEERELFEAVQREADSAELERAAAAMAPPEALPEAPVAGEPKADPGALIRAEHAELLPHLDHLRAIADAAEDESEQRLRERLFQVRRFLRGSLLVHAGLEEESVYPAAERMLREHGGATRTMEIDHELIGRLVDELDAAAEAPAYDDFTRSEQRRLLLSLEALLRGHFEKEERVYVPLLEHLAPASAAALVEQLRTAATTHAHEH